MNKINKNICEITFVYCHYMDVGIIPGFDEVGRNEAELYASVELLKIFEKIGE